MTIRPRLLSAIATAALAALLAPAASTEQPAARVRVDFRVVEADGTPVRDLRSDEIALRMSGKPRKVTALEFFESARAAGSTRSPLPPPFSTSGGPGPVSDLYLVVDEDSLGAGSVKEVRAALEVLLDRVAPDDPVGFYSLRAGGTSVPPTLAHDEVGGAVTTIAARDCVPGPAMPTLTALMRGRQGQGPAALVLFSAGFAAPAASTPRPGCGFGASEVARLVQAVRGVPSQLFVFPVGGSAVHEGVETLARSTGGAVVAWTGDPRAAMERLARETSAFYAATFEVEPGERDGSAARLDVAVTRPGVRALARTAVSLPDARRPLPALTAREMVRGSMPYGELPIRAAAYASSNYDGRVKLVLLYEPADAGASMTAASFSLTDLAGLPVLQSTATAEDLKTRPARAAFVVAPGRYRLRVAATDAARRGGTVDLVVDARLTPAGPVSLSGMLLGGPDVLNFEPRLIYTREPAATAYVELYDVRPGVALDVKFELASDRDSPALVSMPAMLPPATTAGRIATAALPIDRLEPGDYLVRASISVDGQPVGRTFQTLRKQ